MKALGKHLIVELFGCPPDRLDDLALIHRVLVGAVEDSGATLIKPFFHQFSPQGVSGVVIIAESHFSIHTWPEYGYAAVDMFTCGDCIDMDRALETMREGFAPTSIQRVELSRGLLDLPDEAVKHKNFSDNTQSVDPALGLRRVCHAA